MLTLIQVFIAAIVYSASCLSIFWEPLINNFGSIQWDAVNVHFFNLFFSSETLNNGIFPLWTPYIFAGFPQIADLQVAFFYPINLLTSVSIVFTPELVMRQTILHYFLAGFFTFLFAKYLSKNFWFSVAAGLIYSFGGFMAGHASHIGMQNTTAWLPLIFLFLMISLKETKNFYAALSGLFLGIAILAGHFQISIYIACAIAFYSLFDIAWTIIKFQKTIDKKIINPLLRKIRIISIIYIIAFLVSAIQLLPAYELVRESNRAKITLEMSQTESLNPDSLRNLIEPNYNNVSYGAPYTGPWDRTQNYLYIGSAIIVLAALGIFSGIFCRNARKMTVFWLALLTISLLYSFGEFGFLQKYFYRFAPFFDKIRAPSNMMLLFNLSIIGLASAFFNNLDKLSQKFKNIMLVNDSHSTPCLLHTFKRILAKNGSAFLGISALLIISLEIFSATPLNTLLYSRQKTSEVTAAPPIAGQITKEYGELDTIDKFKIFKVPHLDSNLTQVLRVFAFDGYNPLSLKRHSAYIDAMVKNEKLIDLAGIKYLPCEFIAGKTDDLEKIGALCVNKNYFKLAFLIDDYIVAKNAEEALEKIQTADLKKIIVLEETPARIINSANYQKNNLLEKTEQLSIDEFRPGFWRITINTDKDAFLFLNQTNYPGWNAKIDETPVKIYQADYLFQTIFVPKGKHEIIIKYASSPLISGTILTIIGLLCVFLIAIRELYPKKKVF